MSNKILNKQELDSAQEFFSLYEKYKENIKGNHKISFPVVDIIRFAFEETDNIDESILNIPVPEYQSLLNYYFKVYGVNNYNNIKIYNNLLKGIYTLDKVYFLYDIFNKSLILEFSEIYNITEEEAALAFIHGTKFVLGRKDGKLREHRVLGGSANNTKRKTLGYRKLLKSFAIKTLNGSIELSENCDKFNAKILPKNDLKLITALNAYLKYNKRTITNLNEGIKLKSGDYLILQKEKDLDISDFLKKHLTTIKSTIGGHASQKDLKFKKISDDFVKSQSDIIVLTYGSDSYFFDTLNLDKNKNIFQKIETDEVKSYNVYKDLKTGDIINFDEEDAYARLYEDRIEIFEDILTTALNPYSDKIKKNVKEVIENGFDSEKFKTFHEKATPSKKDRALDISRLKHIIEPYFDSLNFPKGSYDKKNEYILNFILDKYRKELKYDNAYKQIRLKTSSGNHVNPDNAFNRNKKMSFFDLKTSYLDKKYSSKSEKELLLLAASYDVASYNIINNNDFILKELNGNTELSKEIDEISNVGFFIHFGDKNKIFSDKKNVLNLIDFKYFEITFIFSDFISLATYNIKLLNGDILTQDELNHFIKCEKEIIDVLKRSFEKSMK